MPGFRCGNREGLAPTGVGKGADSHLDCLAIVRRCALSVFSWLRECCEVNQVRFSHNRIAIGLLFPTANRPRMAKECCRLIQDWLFYSVGDAVFTRVAVLLLC